VATILYFAWVRELVGTSEERIDLPDELSTLGEVASWLRGRSEGHRQAFADLSRLRGAIDQSFAGWDAPIKGAGEIAFFPPVTGG
jgi:molybdopterin synthase sulfur carrier subunit